MKTCLRCLEDKSLNDYYLNKKLRHYGECITCMNTRNIVRLSILKVKAVQYLGGQCQLCGYHKNIKALEFHHRDPAQKDFGIGAHRGRDFDKIRIELDKCDLLCANCHREVHDELLQKSGTINKQLYDQLLDNYSIVQPAKKIHLCSCGQQVSSKIEIASLVVTRELNVSVGQQMKTWLL
jgi:hypothetical protein